LTGIKDAQLYRGDQFRPLINIIKIFVIDIAAVKAEAGEPKNAVSSHISKIIYGQTSRDQIITFPIPVIL